jgi:ribosomal protein L16 Arg81 hydroxylase
MLNSQLNNFNFSNLINPISVSNFVNEYWEKKPLYLPGYLKKFESFFSLDDFYSSCNQSIYLKAGFINQHGEHDEMFIEANEITRLLNSGMTICACNLEQVNSSLAFLCLDAKKQLGLPGSFNFNGYLSSDGKGFGIHFDCRSAWILQVEGSKIWRFSKAPALESPLKSMPLPSDKQSVSLPWGNVEKPSESEFEEVQLKPGDVLYLPSGTWHVTKAVGNSLALTLSYPPFSFIHLFHHLIDSSLLEKSLWRRMIPAIDNHTSKNVIPDSLKERFKECLSDYKTEVSNIELNDLDDVWLNFIQANK